MSMAIAGQLDAPLLLWAVPEDHTGGRLRLNSFCGINLAGHALTRSGRQYNHIFTAPDDPAVLDEILPLARAGRARNQLSGSRLARIGDHPDGFETCHFDPALIQNHFGIEVVQLSLEEHVFSRVRQVDLLFIIYD